MDEQPPELTCDEPLDAGTIPVEPPLVEETSTEYLGRWNRLISTTNWEKGRIISAWRESLLEAGMPSNSYCDEAWSCRVGNVTPQHVGRLRRVFQRFGADHDKYPGLYWSHFQAALDWEDADMYLEGAVHSGWSVAQMRKQRWEAVGAPPEMRPRDEDIIIAELNEDVDPARDEAPPENIFDSPGEVRDAGVADDFETQSPPREVDEAVAADGGNAFDDDRPAKPVQPFKNLPPLPSDLNEAFEAFKLAVLQHRLSGWREISLDNVLAVLDALRDLALAPSED